MYSTNFLQNHYTKCHSRLNIFLPISLLPAITRYFGLLMHLIHAQKQCKPYFVQYHTSSNTNISILVI